MIVILNKTEIHDEINVWITAQEQNDKRLNADVWLK